MVLKQVKTMGWLLLALCLMVGIPGGSTVQAADSLGLIGTITLTSSLGAAQGSQCWGWTAPDGTEYGIMGYRNGMAFIRTTPTIQLCDTVGGPMTGGTSWREMKTYKHYAYLVSEATGTRQGLSVFDMQWLPDSVEYIGSFSTNEGTGFTSHTISIDTAKGYAYVERSSAQPVCIFNLANPEVPSFVGFFDTSATFDIHDMTAINDTVYVAEGNMGTWSVWDLTNKLAPTMIVRVSVPVAGYIHNVWPSPDKQYCATTEETANKTVKIWDISDLGNVLLIDEFLDSSDMAHNAHWLTQDTLVLAHYQSGLIVMDVSNPAAAVRIGKYDTYPIGETAAFQGCWGAYPYTQNGYIYGSNIGGGFYVVKMQSDCSLLSGPALLGPADGAQAQVQPITLTWADNGATSYFVQVDDDPGFAAPLLEGSVSDTTFDVSGLPDEETYFWRVVPWNECGFGSSSGTRSFEASCVVALTGDVDMSGVITSADIIVLVNYVFKGGATPQPVAEAGDCDCSSSVTSSDVIRLVNYVFKGGIPPCDVCSIL